MRRVSLLIALLCVGQGLASARPKKVWLEDVLPNDQAQREFDKLIAKAKAVVDAGDDAVIGLDLDGAAFYSPNRIHWDPELLVVPGVIEFVKEILAIRGRVTKKKENGRVVTRRVRAKLVYYTGRKTRLWKWKQGDSPRQLTPTEATYDELQHLGLPLGPGTKLVMNPTLLKGYPFKEASDTKLKKMGVVVGMIDNEKQNCRLFRKQYPNAMVFRMMLDDLRALPPIYGDRSWGTNKIRVVRDFRFTPSGYVLPVPDSQIGQTSERRDQGGTSKQGTPSMARTAVGRRR